MQTKLMKVGNLTESWLRVGSINGARKESLFISMSFGCLRRVELSSG